MDAGHLDAGIWGREGGGEREGGGGEERKAEGYRERGEGRGARKLALAVIREVALSFRQHAGTPYVAA